MAEPTSVPEGALGLLETLGLVAAIEAADAMLKAADVRLVRQQRTVPGLVTHLVTGETAAVQSAVDAGAAAAERVGRVVARHVIPRPDPSVWRVFGGTARAPVPPAAPASAVSSTTPEPADDYEDRTVRELRQLARDRDDDRLRGRAIAAATKDELVAFLRASE
ncbi:BMC domain-containing protein [Rubrivirga marina]|uniref:BMC domain-containing protein n=1 Tax=Rubrivirga marina TaxID=1196024 RepID=A0A271J6E8_9BACT|nr:hypothetical protein BSZ37_18250 [Rubrivirga marina]